MRGLDLPAQPKVLTNISWDHVELKPNGDVTTGGTPSQYSSWSITPMFIDEYHGLTKVTERYYISNVPFSAATITSESLHPTNVHWELGGSNGNGAVTNCLTSGNSTPFCRALARMRIQPEAKAVTGSSKRRDQRSCIALGGQRTICPCNSAFATLATGFNAPSGMPCAS